MLDMPERQPWRRSPVRVQHGCPPIRFRRPGPGCPARPVSGPPGVQSARCPVRPVSSHLGSSSGIWRPAVWCPPVRCPAVRTCPSGPHQAVALGTGRCGKATRTTGAGPGPCRLPRPRAARADGREGPDAGDAAEVTHGRRGCRWWTRAGSGVAAAVLDAASRVGQAGVRSARRRRLREGTGGGCTGREAAVPGMGGRPLCVVVEVPAARVDGPGGADGLAGGDGRAAPARPRQPASAPGLLPTAL
jgi:hypothetical protein